MTSLPAAFPCATLAVNPIYPEVPMARPNLLLLLSDEHAFRYLGCLPEAQGGEPVSTPALDSLAARGTRFSDVYCQMPLCTPSRMSLLSGREARDCNAWRNGSVLDPAQPTFPKTLAAAGYTTCLVGKMHFGGGYQFHGFQHRPYGDLTGATGHQWEPLYQGNHRGDRKRSLLDCAGPTEIPESLLQERVVAEESVAFLREHEAAQPDTPWLLCASFSRPHFPLTAPPRHLKLYQRQGVTEPRVPRGGDSEDHPFSIGIRQWGQSEDLTDEETAKGRLGYFAAVSYLDEVLGDLLATLERDGLLDNTIILYTSDHGELAGEHGLWWKEGWQEASVRVPLIISTPQQRRGKVPAQVCHEPVGLIDLYRTCCAWAEAPVPPQIAGIDLTPLWRGESLPADRPIVCDHLVGDKFGPGTDYRMVRRGRWKYIGFRDAPELLFDLAKDPDEQVNLADDPAHRELCHELRQYVAETMDFAAAKRQREAWTERTASPEFKLGAEEPVPYAGGNRYLLSSGRLIAADSQLYRPHLLSDDPAATFRDWPGG